MDEQNLGLKFSWACFALAAVPVALACWSTQAAPRGSPLAEERQLQPLGMVQYAVNLRELPATDIVQADFEFWNRGREEMEITKLEPSCGCLSPVLENRKSHYLPGEEGRVVISVKTANESPGPELQTIKVHYTSAGVQREQLLTFRYTVPERKVTVSPPQLLFYQLQGQPGEQVLQVLDTRRANMRVLDAQSRDGDLDLEVGERSVSRDGIPMTAVQVRVAGPVPPGRRNSVVVIKTDDPAYPEINVPVIVFGPSEIQQTSGVATEREASNSSRHQTSGGRRVTQ